MLYTTAIVYLINQIKFYEHFQVLYFHYLMSNRRLANMIFLRNLLSQTNSDFTKNICSTPVEVNMLLYIEN